MKKAVIVTGGKQYIIAKGDIIDVELLNSDKDLAFEPLMVYEDDKSQIGTPIVEGVKVTAKVLDEELKSDKVTSIRFKAKKRVNKTKGHRQKFSRIEITGIISK